jgi:hypothetical protein
VHTGFGQQPGGLLVQIRARPQMRGSELATEPKPFRITVVVALGRHSASIG